MTRGSHPLKAAKQVKRKASKSASRAGKAGNALSRARVLLSRNAVDGSHHEAVELLRIAYLSGVTEAGWEIVGLPSNLRDLAGLSDKEQISLLMEAGLNGDPHAALDLVYRYGARVEIAHLVAVLSKVAPACAEAGEILDEIARGEFPPMSTGAQD